jgi:all-trans-retinol 13,14-reductase
LPAEVIMEKSFDAIVIGSGIGGLAAAAALATCGKRILVLERHGQAGGLTQTFERQGFRFNVGVHYLGGFGPGGTSRRLLDHLAGGRIEMAPIAGAYDRIRLPGLTLPFAPPRSALIAVLKDAFPKEAKGIDGYFDAVDSAASTMGTVFMARNMPGPLARPLAWFKRNEVERWVGRTTWDVVQDFTGDAQLRAALTAQWIDYGSRPAESSFGVHALVTRSYLDGAWYPVGGSGVFARELGRTVEAAGGEIRTGAEVVGIDVEDRRVTGIRLRDGARLATRCVISDAGAHNTMRMLPSGEVDYAWAQDIAELEASTGYIGLYLGLAGDIAHTGADTANTWIYESWDINRSWDDPLTQPRAPALFVAFPSLRDPTHDPGPQQRHTGELVALVNWSAFSQWDRSDDDGGMQPGTAARSESYAAVKGQLRANLLAQFGEHFPGLAPMVQLAEASTPITVAEYTGAEHGAMYGLATTPQRFLSPALRPRTPIGGLLLAGQDACTPGVTGAMMGGLMAAASLEPALWRLLR